MQTHAHFEMTIGIHAFERLKNDNYRF